MTDSFYKQISKESEAFGFSLNDLQIEQLFEYFLCLVETNKVMNLTAITEESEVVTKHFIDCMAIIKAIKPEGDTFVSSDLSGKKLIDVGTGAGFPGLVLKIMFPDLDVTLTDSLMKRLKFLDQVIEKLDLKKIATIHGRAEDLGHQKELRESFDFVTSRAVANLSTLSEYDLPFVKKGGFFVAYKSTGIKDEIDSAQHAIEKLGGKVVSDTEFVLPDTDIQRSIILIQKIKETPKQFPRKAGTPSKDPIV